MRFKEIVRVFGFTVDQFAETIGYSRDAMYKGIRRTAKAQRAVEILKDLSDQMYDVDVLAAKTRFDKRRNAIREFERSLLERGRHG